MPYINEGYRKTILNTPIGEWVAMDAGELNFAITTLIINRLEYYGESSPGYTMLNEAIGVLECAKQELYRRLASPYEDQKKFDNGDVGFEKFYPLSIGS